MSLMSLITMTPEQELSLELADLQEQLTGFLEAREQLRGEMFPIWRDIKKAKEDLSKTYDNGFALDPSRKSFFAAWDAVHWASVTERNEWREFNRLVKVFQSRVDSCRKLLVKKRVKHKPEQS